MPNSRPHPDSIYDVFGIGFGPAGLAIAVALAEHNLAAGSVHPQVGKSFSSLGGLQEAAGLRLGREREETEGRGRTGAGSAASARVGLGLGSGKKLRVCFVEAHDRFKWHPGMSFFAYAKLAVLDGSRMQISFLKDLATMRNPSSSYTFLSYLHSLSPSRLASFISLSTFTPTRREFADYLSWAAKKVQRELEAESGEGGRSEIAFGEQVLAVDAVVPDHPDSDAEAEVQVLCITSRNIATGDLRKRYARNLIVSTGGAAKLPLELDSAQMKTTGRVVHSSMYLERVGGLLDAVVADSSRSSLSSPSSTPVRPIRLAVIGAGQSAAEIFLSLRSFLRTRLPISLGSRPVIDLYIRRGALRPADDSAFSNEIFDPGMSRAVFGLDAEGRKQVLGEARNTNYSVVNPVTLASIYEAMYAQKVEQDIIASDDTSHASTSLNLDPKLVIHPYTELLSASPDKSTPGNSLSLTFSHTLTNTTSTTEYDAVFCGTGYERQGWRDLLFPSVSKPGVAQHEHGYGVSLSDLFEPVSRPAASLPEASTTGASTPDSAFDAAVLPLPLALPSTVFLPRRVLDSDGEDNASHRPTSTGTSNSDSDRTRSISSGGTSGTSSASSLPPSRGSRCTPATKTTTKTPAEGPYPVGENYRLQLPAETSDGRTFRPRVWLQGCNEGTHGISDSLLSVLAVRSGEVVEALVHEGCFGA